MVSYYWKIDPEDIKSGQEIIVEICLNPFEKIFKGHGETGFAY